MPELSAHFESREPSDIRVAQIRFNERNDGTEAINVAIGNVSLPMHPAMIERLRNMTAPDGPFAEGVVRYCPTVGLKETADAFRHVIESSGHDASTLFVQVTDGGSQAMELLVVGLCGPAGTRERPLLMIDPAYTNYAAFAARTGRATVTVARTLGEDGVFSLPDEAELKALIHAHHPSALVVIPYDNPTGQFVTHEAMVRLARLCVAHDLWMVSDEAYRELFYTRANASSIWKLTETEVPGITGRRIGLETASKVWNACGLRTGAILTDNERFHRQAVAENTANLCPNVLGQYVFGALGHVPHAELRDWYETQRRYYAPMLTRLVEELTERLPGVIVTTPASSLYSVVDVRRIVPADFDAQAFVHFCAAEGRVSRGGRSLTLLTAPMAGFYRVPKGAPNPGRTQMRIAYVEPPKSMALVPELFAELLKAYLGR